MRLGDSNLAAADTRIALGAVLWKVGHYGEAIVPTSSAVRARTTALGADNPETADALCELGELLTAAERNAEALKSHLQALNARVAVLGAGHKEVARAQLCVSRDLLQLGCFRAASAASRAALRACTVAHGACAQVLLQRRKAMLACRSLFWASLVRPLRTTNRRNMSASRCAALARTRRTARRWRAARTPSRRARTRCRTSTPGRWCTGLAASKARSGARGRV